jgi:hypothetical protein
MRDSVKFEIDAKMCCYCRKKEMAGERENIDIKTSLREKYTHLYSLSLLEKLVQ